MFGFSRSLTSVVAFLTAVLALGGCARVFHKTKEVVNGPRVKAVLDEGAGKFGNVIILPLKFQVKPLKHEGYFLEELTFGPATNADKKACEGKIVEATLQFSNKQSQFYSTRVPVRYDCRVTFSFQGNDRPYVGDGQRRIRVIFQASPYARDGVSFRLGLKSRPFRAVGEDSGRLLEFIEEVVGPMITTSPP